jgi:hypothetical protein
MKTIVTRSGSRVSPDSVASADVWPEAELILRAAVDASRTARRGTRSASLRDLESAIVDDINAGRDVKLGRVLKMILLAQAAGADTSGFVATISETLTPSTHPVPATLAHAIDLETGAECESNPIEVQARAWDGRESIGDLDRLIASARKHRDAKTALIKAATSRKLERLRGFGRAFA